MLSVHLDIDPEKRRIDGPIVPAETRFTIDPVALVKALEPEDRDELLLALAAIPGSEFVEALEDKAAAPVRSDGKFVLPMTERGFVILDCFVERAVRLDRLPDDYESPAMRAFGDDADRLHEAICDGRTADACALLRQMVPDHPFVSDAARLMLARARGQEALL